MHINEDLFYCPISETFEYFGMEDINQQNEKEKGLEKQLE